MRKVLTLALVCLVSLCYSQKPPAKFGDVSKEEVEMKVYAADTSAAAVKLLDYGESNISFNQGAGWFTLNFERLIRIKILKKDGYEWADFQIPIYNEGGNSEKVTSLKGITYNFENGKVIESKLKKDGIFDEKVTENWSNKKLTMPDVKVGSVIEISYTVSSDFYTHLNDWEFQSTIPVIWSEYRLRIPEYYSFDKYMQGYISLSVKEEGMVPASINWTTRERSVSNNVVKSEVSNHKVDLMENRMRYVAENVPAFKPEPYITTPADYISKINFELAYIKYPQEPVKPILGTWDDINKTYFEHSDFGAQIKGNNFLKNKVEEIISNSQTSEDKISVIFNYVKQNTAWDKTYRKFVSTPLRKVLDDKRGSSAEVNFLLASMLEKANFDVYPVLVSTRNNGFVREGIPVASQFNTMICLVKFEDKSVLLDATSRYLPIGVLPQNCLNGKGLVISAERSSWVNLESTLKSRFLVNTEFTIADDESLKGKIGMERTGYEAQKSRNSYFVDGEEKYLESIREELGWEISNSAFIDTKELSMPFKEEHEFEVSDQITSSADIYYIDPFITGKMEENIFKLEDRQYPVNFGSPFEKIYMAKIIIPEGYEMEELPESKILKLPENGARYIYSVNQIGNVINILSNLSINRSIFSQVEYPNLREFYNQVVAKQAEMIVIKKK